MTNMNVELANRVPDKDGYYLVKMNSTAGLHLVLIQTDIAGNRSMVPDTFSSRTISISINEAHANLFKDALFSQTPITIIV
jgi:hypothetical protein